MLIVENIHLRQKKKHTSGHKRLLKRKIDGASADSTMPAKMIRSKSRQGLGLFEIHEKD